MEKNMKKNEFEYMYAYNWITMLYTWNWHILNQLYSKKIF